MADLALHHLRRLLLEERQRGMLFDDVWTSAVTRAAPSVDRAAWCVAVNSTRSTWARAYAGVPMTRAEHAVIKFLAGQERGEYIEDSTRHRCQHCKGDIPQGRGSRRPANYCSDNCRRRAHDQRHATHASIAA